MSPGKCRAFPKKRTSGPSSGPPLTARHGVRAACSQASIRPMVARLPSSSSPSRTIALVSVVAKTRATTTSAAGLRSADAVPAVFTKIRLHFIVTGVGLKENHVKRAVELSAEKYCSASIMLGAAGVEMSHSYEIVEFGA